MSRCSPPSILTHLLPSPLLFRWPKHTQDHTAQYLINVAQALKKESTTRSIQAVGYCYGAVGVLTLFQKGLASSGAVAHPTGFTKENVDQVNAPLLFNCAETDSMFPPELRSHWETTLKEKMVPAKFVGYPGTDHGFAVRDDGTPAGVAARQRALQETVSFLKQGAAA
jgi:dienelactone hydrolase